MKISQYFWKFERTYEIKYRGNEKIKDNIRLTKKICIYHDDEKNVNSEYL